jgi:SSS family solute:Na+ symporter
MNALHVVDYAIILLYFILVSGVGFFFRKIAAGSLENYFLGGRRLPWWLLGASGMAHFFDMAGTMLIVSFLYLLGPRGLYIEFRGGAVLTLAFMMCWLGKWHRRSQCMTNAEWMNFRFGEGRDGNAARLLTAISGLIWGVGIIAYLAKGAGLFLSMFIPINPMACALIMLSVATLYTMSAGFFGVVVTDFIQSALIIFAAIYLSVTAFFKVAEPANFASLTEKVTGNASWITTLPSWKTEMPQGYEPYEFLGMFALFYFIRSVIGGMGTGDDPKYFAARSDRECGKLTFLWTSLIMVRWPMMIGIAVLGIFLVAQTFPDQAVLLQSADLIKQFQPEVVGNKHIWPELLSGIINAPDQYSPALINGLKEILGNDWMRDLNMVSFEGTVNPERILPAVLLYQIPAGVRGLLLVALLAAAMSSFDSELNKPCGLFVRDIYQKFLRPTASVRELIFASRATCVGIASAGFAMTYSAESINDIWSWFIMGLGSGLIAPMVLRLYWWRFNGYGFAGGIVFGLGGALVQRFLWPEMGEWSQFIIFGSLSFGGALLGTFLTLPTERSVLEHFYKTTRPFGFWGPLKDTLSELERQAVAKEHRNDILALPFALVWQVCLFLLPMQVVIHAYGDMWFTLPLFLIGLAGLYWFWYRNLPHDQPEDSVKSLLRPSIDVGPRPTAN